MIRISMRMGINICSRVGVCVRVHIRIRNTVGLVWFGMVWRRVLSISFSTSVCIHKK